MSRLVLTHLTCCINGGCTAYLCSHLVAKLELLIKFGVTSLGILIASALLLHLLFGLQQIHVQSYSLTCAGVP